MIVCAILYEVENIHCRAVKSFVDLTRHIFTIPGVKAFLSENLTQDPIEKFFGCQRQRCGASEIQMCKSFAMVLRPLG